MSPLIPDGARVFADSSPIIYVLEDNPDFAPAYRWFFEGVEAGRFACIVSTITVAEVLVGPIRAQRLDLAHRYRQALTFGRGFEARSMTVEIAQRAAEFRVQYGLKLPDAIQLATAIDAGAHYLLTGDRDFGNVTAIQVVRC